jgi:hypothetical protein
MAMKSKLMSLAMLAALALPVGCQQTGDTNIDTATQQVKAQYSGPEQHLIEALYSLDLRPEQRATLEGLVADTQTRLVDAKQAVADLMREAARGIRKGSVNEERLRILAENLKGEFHKSRPVVIASLNSVHKTLDRAQRKQLVAALRAKHKERMANRFGGDMDGPGFHGHGHMGRGRGHGHMGRGRHRLRRIAEKLGLSKNQRGRIKDAIDQGIAAMQKGQPSPESRQQNRREKIRAAAKTFLSDGFEAANLPFLDKPQAPGLEKLGKILKMSKLILPILSQQQRDKIAAHLEFRADIIAPANQD